MCLLSGLKKTCSHPLRWGVQTQVLSRSRKERRLFYVALTRAEENAYLSFAKQRYRWGKLDFCNPPSRFITEVDPRYLDLPEDNGIGYDREPTVAGGYAGFRKPQPEQPTAPTQPGRQTATNPQMNEPKVNAAALKPKNKIKILMETIRAISKVA